MLLILLKVVCWGLAWHREWSAQALEHDALMLQELELYVESAPVAAGGAVRPDYAVAGHHDWDRIAVESVANRARSA